MRILALVHQADAGPGVFAEAITQTGATLELCHVGGGEQPPEDLGPYRAVLSFGGGMHVDQAEAHPWLDEERRLLERLIEQHIPLLTVCLGAQLLAEAAGARVARAPVPEIGWYEVRRTRQGLDDPLLAALPPRFQAFQWHSYEFPLPPNAVPLARSENCLQAYRVGMTAWGIQFHAEVTLDAVESWISYYRSDRGALALGIDPERRRGARAYALRD